MVKHIGIRGILIGLVVTLAIGGTIAWAAIPSSVSGLITVCYPNSGTSKGILRVIDAEAGAHCAAGETQMKFQSGGMRFKGAWDSSTVYFASDLVTDSGGAFVRLFSGGFPGVPTSNTAYWASLGGGGGCGFPHAGVNWTGCDFNGANLSSANLTGANLTNANLQQADLSHALLTSANLTGANLNVASLFHASLVNATLTGATFLSVFGAAADLTGADFTNADLTSANFQFVTGADSATWSNTTCPDGSNSDGNGGTCVGFGI